MVLQRLMQFIAWPVATGLLIALLVLLLFPHLRPQPAQPPAAPSGNGFSGPVSYSDAVNRAAPSVVNIYTTKIVQRRYPSPADHPYYRHLFNNSSQQVRTQSTLGSGVIVDTEGHILTNNHIIEGADEILVLLHDGRETAARLVGVDTETDLAVLKISLDNLTAANLGDPSRARVGDVVLAIGNPYGVGQSVSLGIVSATGRYNLGTSYYENFIQTDAAINPGNSGGALIDVQGRLIGINTAVLDETGASIGIGFAIPADSAMKSLESIVRHGRVVRGSLGLLGRVLPLREEFIRQYSLDVEVALLVERVDAQGSAHLAGIKPGDLITHLNQQALVDGRRALNLIADTPPGTQIQVRLIRDTQVLDVTATVGIREPSRTRT